MKSPCKIIHARFVKNDNFADLANKASKACHMSRGETALLMYYAGCSSGFKPAAHAIAEAIGVGDPYVYILRDALKSKGIIDVSGGNVVVNWARIKILASLKPELTKKAAWIKPQTPTVIDRIGKTMALHPSFWELYTLRMEKLIDMFGCMSNAEYATWRRVFKKAHCA